MYFFSNIEGPKQSNEEINSNNDLLHAWDNINRRIQISPRVEFNFQFTILAVSCTHLVILKRISCTNI